jgi:hypothetical protein
MMRAAAGGVTVLECLRRERLHQPFQKTVSGHQFRQMWDHDMVDMLDEEIVDDDHLLATYHDYRGRDEPANSRRLRNLRACIGLPDLKQLFDLIVSLTDKKTSNDVFPFLF